MLTFSQIVVATDFDPAADSAVQYACSVARAFGAALHVVHVVEDLSATAAPIPGVAIDTVRLQAEMLSAAQRRLDAIVARACTGVHVSGIVLTAHGTAQAILDYARNVQADLIIGGTHGRSRLAGFFMGSVAQQLVRTAPCPVLTVHAPVTVAA